MSRGDVVDDLVQGQLVVAFDVRAAVRTELADALVLEWKKYVTSHEMHAHHTYYPHT